MLPILSIQPALSNRPRAAHSRTAFVAVAAALVALGCSSRPNAGDAAADGALSDGNIMDGSTFDGGTLDGSSADAFLDSTITLPGTPPGTEALFPPGGTPSVDMMRTPSFIYPA